MSNATRKLVSLCSCKTLHVLLVEIQQFSSLHWKVIVIALIELIDFLSVPNLFQNWRNKFKFYQYIYIYIVHALILFCDIDLHYHMNII